MNCRAILEPHPFPDGYVLLRHESIHLCWGGGGDPDVAAQGLSTQRAADNLLWLSCPGTLLPE